MKKFFTVLAAAALVTVFVSSAFAANNISRLVSTRGWIVDGINFNATSGGQTDASSWIGNLTISASTWQSTGTNASNGNFTAGTLVSNGTATSVVSYVYDGFIADNASKFGYTNVDVVMAWNSTNPTYASYSPAAYGYVTPDNKAIFAMANSTFGRGFNAGLVSLVDKGSLTPANMITNVAQNAQWYYFSIGTNATENMTGSETFVRVGNFTKINATTNATLVEAYEAGSATGNTTSVNGTFYLNASMYNFANAGINLCKGAPAQAARLATAYNVFTNATMDANGEMIVGVESYDGSSVVFPGPQYNNATVYTVALKNPQTFSSLAGSWKMVAVVPASDDAYIGDFTLNANNAPSGGTIVNVAYQAGGSIDAETTASFLTNWSFGVTQASKAFFPTATFDLTQFVITDAAGGRTLTLYGRKMLSSHKNIIVGIGEDNAGQKAFAILSGTPSSSSSDDDDDFLGCVFNPAASFGLEWLLLLLAPALAVLRSRFRK